MNSNLINHTLLTVTELPDEVLALIINQYSMLALAVIVLVLMYVAYKFNFSEK